MFRARARADIEEIVDYLENRSQLGARNVARAIYAAIGAIGQQPEGSQKTDDADVRVKTVQGYPYRIFYLHAEMSSKYCTFATRLVVRGRLFEVSAELVAPV